MRFIAARSPSVDQTSKRSATHANCMAHSWPRAGGIRVSPHSAGAGE
jgi:hypothetical protein